MELRHLRYFLVVAEELHFGRAAERLFMAQPPLSVQIQQLERELGFPLFTRTKRRVELTEAGRLFLEEARDLLAGLERAAHAGRRVARGETGRLAIGFVGSATFSILPNALRTFRRLYPDVELTLRELVSARQADALRDRRVHVGFARPAIEAPDIMCESILSEPFVAALPQSHPLARRKRLSLAALSAEEFVLFPRLPKPSYADLLYNACEQAGFQPNVTQETAEIQTAISLVAGGLGVTLAPASAQNALRHGVVFVPLQEPVPHSDLTMVYRRDDDTPALRAFLAVVRDL